MRGEKDVGRLGVRACVCDLCVLCVLCVCGGMWDVECGVEDVEWDKGVTRDSKKAWEV